MQKLKILLIVLPIFLLYIPVATPEAGYLILSDVVSSSGCEAKSESYLLGVSIAQPVVGMSSNPVYIESAGFWHWNMSWPGPEVGIKSEPDPDLPLPKEYSLSQNFPNPFNPTTLIRYQLPAISTKRSAVSLKIYNILGQRVRTLVEEEQAPGYYSVVWNGRDDYGRGVASGVYLYRLEAGRYSSSKKLLLLK